VRGALDVITSSGDCLLVEEVDPVGDPGASVWVDAGTIVAGQLSSHLVNRSNVLSMSRLDYDLMRFVRRTAGQPSDYYAHRGDPSRQPSTRLRCSVVLLETELSPGVEASRSSHPIVCNCIGWPKNVARVVHELGRRPCCFCGRCHRVMVRP